MEILKTRPEEDLVVRLRNRTAKRTAGIIKGIGGLLNPAEIIQPVIGIQSMVASGKERAAVIGCAPGLCHGSYDNRPLLFFGTKVGREDLEFLQEIRVRIHRSIAVASRVGHMSAVQRDVKRVCREAVVREIVVSTEK